ALSNVQVDVMTALVSFDRVFEVLDLKPLITERPGAVALPGPAPGNGGGARRPPPAGVELGLAPYPHPPRRWSSTGSRSATRRPARCRWRHWSRSRWPRPSGPTAGRTCCTR